jgi:predicted transcriptional regulator YheO
MTPQNFEKYKAAIQILDSDTIKAIHEIFKSDKISFSTLNRLALKNKFLESFDGKKPIATIAKEMKISKMTLYRMLNKKRASKKLKNP